ncbi:ATP-dependent RNA helicase SUPV3L1, mitochondrial [Morella rubra]|uniref:ATP-dependent RNA helicase SUPV3L1, mitochondrial n=1 Tax=Morella rubra TaxID=262757 RepID=A0A6A1VYV2_9ROSI|nr:ATP-dependent RNA helicase SUPV3L1, mitochondrial [Morella rubra]
MLGCRTRGFSFTRALLGISADELHLCGDAASGPLIQEMLKVTGDEVEVQFYERLSPLVPAKVPLGSFSHIQTGDCIVTFSRREIYRLKSEIESGGKHLCSVVYGSLPPETRTRQATMFNDASSDFDVLVASDAIGMGLNLNISRIIFSTMEKFDGIEMRDLTIPEIKQIAGRAGRYGSKFPVGEVTCIDAEDLPLLHSSLNAPSPTLEEHFLENAKLSENYFIADCEETLKVAAVIDEMPLGLHEKYLFCISPVDMGDEISSQGLTQFAKNYATKGIVRLREIFTPGTLQVPKTQAALKELESIHKVLDLYVWLSFRLEESFPDRGLASSQKAICNVLIEEFLERLGGLNPRTRRLPTRRSLSSVFSKDIRPDL